LKHRKNSENVKGELIFLADGNTNNDADDSEDNEKHDEQAAFLSPRL
jgi:hypothetical protein